MFTALERSGIALVFVEGAHDNDQLARRRRTFYAAAMAKKKTATFAITHMSVAFLVGWALTGSAALGGALALVEPLVNTAAYFFHEKLWERLRAAA
jgi:uncharacterized membrane protein